MKKSWFSLYVFFCMILVQQALAQGTRVEGYVFETNNRGYLNQVSIEIRNDNTGRVAQRVFSNIDGFFEAVVEQGGPYTLIANKEMFHSLDLPFHTNDGGTTGKVFLKVEMHRAPGYIFEITLAEKRDSEEIPVNAIRGARIEVYNNTTKKEVLRLEDYEHPEFRVNLVKNNHYTILIRKKGYLAKRMEAFVDVEGCILCFEGIGQVMPGVSDNLTEGHEMGTLLANVEMEPLFRGKKIEIENIYYDFNKWNIRPDAAVELDKVVTFLRDNPHLTVELGSHTDARGTTQSNQVLSEKRAQSAVGYLTTTGRISRQRIHAKGYGESEISNRCVDGVDCDEEEHAANRRTELKILGIEEQLVFKSLTDLKKEEEMERLIAELQNQEVVRVEAGAELPEELKKSLDRDGVENVEVPDNEPSSDAIPAEEVHVPEVTTDLAVPEEETDADKAGVSETIEMPVVENAEPVEVQTDVPQANDGEQKVDLSDYTGFKVALLFARFELPKDHRIYQEFEDVIAYPTADGNHIYMTGDYKRRLDAVRYLNEVIRPEYPTAYLVGFVDGKRVE